MAVYLLMEMDIAVLEVSFFPALFPPPQSSHSRRRKMSVILCSKDSTGTPKGAGSTSLISSEFHLVKMLDLIFSCMKVDMVTGFLFMSLISPDAVTLCSLLNPMGARSLRLGV